MDLRPAGDAIILKSSNPENPCLLDAVRQAGSGYFVINCLNCDLYDFFDYPDFEFLRHLTFDGDHKKTMSEPACLTASSRQGFM